MFRRAPSERATPLEKQACFGQSHMTVFVAYAEEGEANALSELPEPRTHREAERLYKSAIKRLGQTHPLQRFRIGRNLGFLKIEEGSWSAASRALREAAKVASDPGFLAFHRGGLFREGDLAECYSSQ